MNNLIWISEQLNLDFSEFHDLSHSLWQCLLECFEGTNQYGGWQHHLYLDWTYRWENRLRSNTLCRLGKHSKPSPMWRRRPDESAFHMHEREPDKYVCINCYKLLDESTTTEY